MVMPLVVQTTFMLSGMLGLKLEGLVDANGNSNTVETYLPFSMGNGNQTALMAMMSLNQTFLEMMINKTLSVNENKWGEKTGLNTGSNPRISCGPGYCNDKEVCVSWIKENSTRKSRESAMMAHECLPDDGNHYTKMDPTGAQLCGKGKIHSIIHEPQPCLKNRLPCNLVWKYKCINLPNDNNHESALSTHSCKLKKCPTTSTCLELIDCAIDPPCITQAVCVRGGRIIGRA